MSGTTDQVIDDTIGGLIADLQNASEAEGGHLSDMVDRLIAIRTQLRNGRGDDWMGLADPIENLALAGYRADAIINKQMTPPNWDFATEDIKKSWRLWASDTADDM
jgi:hypothetical protein